MKRLGFKIIRISVVGALLLLVPGQTSKGYSQGGSGEANILYDTALYQSLQYRMIGPHKGTRSTAVAGIATEPRTFYFGGTGGGVWKTTDGGETWFNVTDPYFKTGAVGAIDVANSDPNIIYVGTGSACIRGNVVPGIGLYKSTDAGKSWKHVGLKDVGQIGRVIIHPDNPDLVYVAALGHAFGPNEERGVFRTKDGGESWEKVLHVSEKTGADTLAMDSNNPRVIYATMWTAERKPWAMISGSEEGGVYKTTDGGDVWEKLTEGLPTGMIGRTGITVSPANPNRVWALVEAREGGLFRSDDAGKSFRRISQDRELQNRPWYYMHVYSDPLDENTVYVVSRYFQKSIDGGVTFQPIAMPHGDNHDLWINPNDSNILIQGNDGGASVSFNGTKSWSTQLNQPTAEMYRVSVDNQFPYRVYGSQQDTWEVLSVPSRTANFGKRLQLQHWDGVGGMEGGVAVVRPDNPNIVYSGSTSGAITRYDRSTGQIRPIKAYPEVGGMPAMHLRYRFQRTAPIALSPHDPNALYHCSNYVHKSTNEGQSWEVISPDLTRNDPEKLSTFGGPISREVTSEEIYCTIFAFAESPHQSGLLWAGTDDGLVHISRDGGANWEDITPKDMPEWGTVNTLDLSAHDPARAFIAVLRHRLDDFHPYVFRTDDYGKNWKLLTNGKNGIPENDFVRVVREDPDRKGLLYAGAEFGMYLSFDDGAHWQSLQLNFPVTPTTDLVVHQKDLVLSTEGRSFWILDDVTPLHQINDQVAESSAYLFEPRSAFRVQTAEEEANNDYVGGAEYVTNARDLYGGARIERHRLGTDAPDGAIIYSYFSEEPEGEVTLEILDQEGNLVRAFSSLDDPKDPSVVARPEPPYYKKESTFHKVGMNRFIWDLRHTAASSGTPLGPKVIPGTYQVKLTAGTWTQTEPLQVLPDPRLDTTESDYEAQFDLLIRIRDHINQIRSAVSRIRDVRKQATDLTERLEDSQQGESLEEASRALTEKLTDIEQILVPTDRDYERDDLDYAPKSIQQWVLLYGYVGGTDAKPTDGAHERFEDLKRELAEPLDSLKAVLDTELAAFNDRIRQSGAPPVIVPKP